MFKFSTTLVRRLSVTQLSASVRPRYFGGAAAKSSFLSPEEITPRVLDVVKSFDKVDKSKVNKTAHFQKDLGLDSLDAVEVVMAIEDEFVIEIPDDEANKIQSCADAINYVSTHAHAK